MDNNELDVFARARLFLKQARLEQAGYTAVLRVVRVGDLEESNEDTEAHSA